ncbi:MAG TPA: CvpA family protein [Campylobacterales bacterium]|nr:CvpA family protein [Campylobacterales bacterium]
MEFMGFHVVDIVIVALAAFLAIKGLVNGFSKELLNFITIVGGVFVAARYNEAVVQFINEQELVPTIPEEFSKIIGFVLIILSIWLLVGFISSIITKLTARPSGFLSRLFGYVLSAARYLFIFSLIIFGVSQSEFFEKSATKFKTETQLFEPMTQIGAKILNIDLNTTEENNSTNLTDINLTINPSTLLAEDNSSK